MKRFISFLMILFVFAHTSFAQKKYQIRTIAFYNLENLFDTINDPNKKDELSPIMEMKKGRTEAYIQKIKNMAKVLSEIGKKETGNSPTVIGIAEIENIAVIEDLLKTNYLKNKNYGIIHYDSPDLRGIDVAFLYQRNHFVPEDDQTFELKLWDTDGIRLYTRDQLLVKGYLDGELMYFIINHWPSRRGGEKRSSIKREKAAYLNTQIIAQIKNETPHAKIIIMGDLNDDPINKSLKKVLHTKAKKKNVLEGDIYNPYEDLFRRGQNTLVYRDNLNLFDQIMFSSPLLANKKDYHTYKFYKAKIFKPAYLTTQTGKYKGYPYRSWGHGTFTGGYSDHYPSYILLIKAYQN
ncbi:MAG: endonuclease/exonuclease/phosphatase family protein [Lutibacter sp.]